MAFKTLRENYIIADKNVSCTRLSACKFLYFKDVFVSNKNMKTHISFIIIIIFIIITSVFFKFDLLRLVLKLQDESRK